MLHQPQLANRVNAFVTFREIKNLLPRPVGTEQRCPDATLHVDPKCANPPRALGHRPDVGGLDPPAYSTILREVMMNQPSSTTVTFPSPVPSDFRLVVQEHNVSRQSHIVIIHIYQKCRPQRLRIRILMNDKFHVRVGGDRAKQRTQCRTLPQIFCSHAVQCRGVHMRLARSPHAQSDQECVDRRGRPAQQVRGESDSDVRFVIVLFGPAEPAIHSWDA